MAVFSPVVAYERYVPIFEKYKIAEWQAIATAWQEPHRFYHNEEHLEFLLERIAGSSLHTKQEKELLYLVAFFHDIVYQAKSNENEALSVAKFQEMSHADANIKRVISQMIMDTKTHRPQSPLSADFCQMDLSIVSESNFAKLIDWEKRIFKEFQVFDYSLYRSGRIAVLEKLKAQNPKNAHNLDYLIQYIEQFRPNIGVYPGSFNPFHNGHLNVLEKAEKVFDKVIITRGVNPEKTDTLPENNINPALYYRQTEDFKGLLTDYLNSKETYAQITLIRGLRNGDDLAYEMNQMSFMKDLKADLQVVFFRCDRDFEHISSSAIRNLEKIGVGFGTKYLP